MLERLFLPAIQLICEQYCASAVAFRFSPTVIHYSNPYFVFVFFLKGYSTILRTLTSGNATFSLELDVYDAMNPQDQNVLLKRLSGLL